MFTWQGFHNLEKVPSNDCSFTDFDEQLGEFVPKQGVEVLGPEANGGSYIVSTSDYELGEHHFACGVVISPEDPTATPPNPGTRHCNFGMKMTINVIDSANENEAIPGTTSVGLASSSSGVATVAIIIVVVVALISMAAVRMHRSKVDREPIESKDAPRMVDVTGTKEIMDSLEWDEFA